MIFFICFVMLCLWNTVLISCFRSFITSCIINWPMVLAWHFLTFSLLVKYPNHAFRLAFKHNLCFLTESVCYCISRCFSGPYSKEKLIRLEISWDWVWYKFLVRNNTFLNLIKTIWIPRQNQYRLKQHQMSLEQLKNHLLKSHFLGFQESSSPRNSHIHKH